MEETPPRTTGDQSQSADSTEDQHLTSAQLSKLLNVPVNTIYYWINRGEVPYVRLGPRTVRFSRRAILEWMSARVVPVAKGNER